MPVRIVEGQLPYTGGTGIEIDANKVISLLLREENNLILVNDDNEIYTDLQLASGLTPQSDFPVGVTTGKVLEADGRPQSGLMLNWKTTSGDYARWIYCADGEIYFDGGNGVWRKVYYSSEVDALLLQLKNYVDLNFQPKLTAGAGITIDANNVISAQGAGTGDVSGPNSAVNGHLAVFDGTTGKAIKDGGPIPTQVQVIDNLTSTSTTSALSANQGKVLNDKIDASVNTKTFFLTGTTGATNIATAQDAIDWYLDGKNPLLMYNNKCYTMVNYYRNVQEASPYIFATSLDGETTSVLQLIVLDGTSTVTDIYESTTTNYSSATRTFLMPAGTGLQTQRVAQKVLDWYLLNNAENYNNKYNPIILSADSLGSGQYTYHLTGKDTGVLIFTSLIVTGGTSQAVERIIINYTGTSVTSLQRDSQTVGGGSEIVYATQAEYNALLPGAASDGKHYFIYSTDGGGGWQPGVNTVAYFPFESDQLDKTGNYVLTANGTQQATGYKFDVACSVVGGEIPGINFIGYWYNSHNENVNGNYDLCATAKHGYIAYNVSHMTPDINNKIVFFSNSSYAVGATSPGMSYDTWHYFAWSYVGGQLVICKDGVVSTLYNGDGYNFGNGFSLNNYGTQSDPTKEWTIFSNLIIENTGWTAQEMTDYYDLTKGDYGIS